MDSRMHKKLWLHYVAVYRLSHVLRLCQALRVYLHYDKMINRLKALTHMPAKNCRIVDTEAVAPRTSLNSNAVIFRRNSSLSTFIHSSYFSLTMLNAIWSHTRYQTVGKHSGRDSAYHISFQRLVLLRCVHIPHGHEYNFLVHVYIFPTRQFVNGRWTSCVLDPTPKYQCAGWIRIYKRNPHD